MPSSRENYIIDYRCASCDWEWRDCLLAVIAERCPRCGDHAAPFASERYDGPGCAPAPAVTRYLPRTRRILDLD